MLQAVWKTVRRMAQAVYNPISPFVEAAHKAQSTLLARFVSLDAAYALRVRREDATLRSSAADSTSWEEEAPFHHRLVERKLRVRASACQSPGSVLKVPALVTFVQ